MKRPLGIRTKALQFRDYDAILSTWRSAGVQVRTRGRDSRSAIRSQLRRNRGLYLGAFRGPELVGLVLATHDTRKGWINRLAVRPEYRRRGIARELVRAAERVLAARGIDIVAALVELRNEPSLWLFRRLGYEAYPLHYVRKKRSPST